MPEHLRYAGMAPAEQIAALRAIVAASPMLMDSLRRALALALPDWWIVAGAIYNTVWNALTGRLPLTGIKDIDLFYFDGADLSYEAEDAVIRRAVPMFAELSVPVEIRNQARVHLWYEAHFGEPCAAQRSSADAIDHFASRTHSVAVRLTEAGEIVVYSPYGLDDLFSFRITPNHLRSNQRTHETKGARALSIWPELTLVPW